MRLYSTYLAGLYSFNHSGRQWMESFGYLTTNQTLFGLRWLLRFSWKWQHVAELLTLRDFRALMPYLWLWLVLVCIKMFTGYRIPVTTLWWVNINCIWVADWPLYFRAVFFERRMFFIHVLLWWILYYINIVIDFIFIGINYVIYSCKLLELFSMFCC